jgi:hypothetical protein
LDGQDLCWISSFQWSFDSSPTGPGHTNLYQITKFCISSDFSTYLLKTLGALSVGTGLHSIATTLIFEQKVTRAMALALLPRFAYLMVALVVKPVQGMRRDVLAVWD